MSSGVPACEQPGGASMNGESVPPSVSTGGGGDQFEQHVAALALGLLLVRGMPPVLTDTSVVEVHFQTRHRGWRTDDLLVVGERSDGSRRRLALQVKRSFRISASRRRLPNDDPWHVARLPGGSIRRVGGPTGGRHTAWNVGAAAGLCRAAGMRPGIGRRGGLRAPCYRLTGSSRRRAKEQNRGNPSDPDRRRRRVAGRECLLAIPPGRSTS